MAVAVVEQANILTGTDFYRVCGRRRSIRWYKTWKPVEREKIQRILEVVRVTTSSPGNVQPWKAVVVEQTRIPREKRDRLLYADNLQGPHVTAPVWIYWFGDTECVKPHIFKARLREQIAAGAAPTAHGWSEAVMEPMIDRGEPAPQGLPGLNRIAMRMAPGFSA